ncbi:Ribosomal protein L7A [Spraguea lophii 42_110]|uniref:H/ACA ribonucleoprotein complex subunit 2 n=1 Tax=Spraguea lophii (strain 42_110) TaxID=1358809 RepID=S7XJP3_SPRLO|nr:Ribosomal protein L7A [Spraguea lophii 42_110]
MTISEKAQPLASGELNNKILEVVKAMKDANAIRTGANEVTKVLNKGNGLLVLLAADCEPIEITAHIPVICGEKDVPYVYVNGKDNLGKACNISRPVVACVVFCDNEQRYNHIQKSVSKIIKEINN